MLISGNTFASHSSPFPNITPSSICADGENASGCYINTTGVNYSLNGNISPDIYVTGIEYTTGANDNTTIIIGDINTTGEDAYGLYFHSSDSNTTTITGNISTRDDRSYGIYFYNSNSNTTIINGNINIIQGFIGLASGIKLRESDNNITIINGDIVTTGNSTDGVEMGSGSDFNTLTINGNISTIGTGSRGIFLNGNSNTIKIKGNINNTGDFSSHGVDLYNSNNNEVIIDRSISVTGVDSNAINVDNNSSNNTFSFNQGAIIIGEIYNDGTNNSLNFNLGRAASYNFSTSGEESWELNDTYKTVVTGSVKSRGTADIEDVGNNLYQRFHLVYDRLIQNQLDFLQSSLSHNTWVDTYFTDRTRNTVGEQINQETRGITMGFDFNDKHDMEMDMIVNVEDSKNSYGLDEQIINTNSVMAGLSLSYITNKNKNSLGLQFLAGTSDNKRTLVVLDNTLTTGKTEVNDTYNSTYASVGTQWLQVLQNTQSFDSHFVFGMDVKYAKINGSKASAYYVLADRDLTQLTTQVQIRSSYKGEDKKLSFNNSLSLANTNTLQGERQNYTIDGSAAHYKTDKNNTIARASVEANYRFSPNAYAFVNLEVFDSTDNIDGTTGSIGLAIDF